jgi:uncharacterized protein (TIGR03435 family)
MTPTCFASVSEKAKIRLIPEEVMKCTTWAFVIGITIPLLLVSGRSNHDGGAFDVASVRPHDPGVPTQGMKLTPNGINYSRVTLHECIMAAYNVFGFQIRETESEMVSERYDIVAKTDHQVDKAELMLMLQALLKERFKLQLHREVKELPVYVLVGGKKRPKLEIVNDAGEGSLRFNGEGAIFKRTSMPRFAEFLSGLGSIQRPVLDQTSLQGVYDPGSPARQEISAPPSAVADLALVRAPWSRASSDAEALPSGRATRLPMQPPAFALAG